MYAVPINGHLSAIFYPVSSLPHPRSPPLSFDYVRLPTFLGVPSACLNRTCRGLARHTRDEIRTVYVRTCAHACIRVHRGTSRVSQVALTILWRLLFVYWLGIGLRDLKRANILPIFVVGTLFVGYFHSLSFATLFLFPLFRVPVFLVSSSKDRWSNY